MAARITRTIGLLVGAIAALLTLVGTITASEAFIASKRVPKTNKLHPTATVTDFGDEYDGAPIELTILGDSLAVGVGTERDEEAIGSLLATGLVVASHRGVRVYNMAATGSESKDLPGQLDAFEKYGVRPDVTVIIIGGNDVMHLARITTAVQSLRETVRRVRETGSQVVVATCPDMGTVRPFSQPLRFFAHILSRLLATSQTIVVLRGGGRTVSLADLLGPLFREDPSHMFSSDSVHPSALGYARAAEVILPSVCVAAGYSLPDTRVPHRVYLKARRRRLEWFAFRATRQAGTGVSRIGSRQYRLSDAGRRNLLHLYRRRRTRPGASASTSSRS